MCAMGRVNLCERIAFGHLEPGLQSGFCESTGGGWSTGMVAHNSQLVDVPDDLTDEAAVLVEPMACAVHAAGQVTEDRLAVIGAGALGLLTIAALRALNEPGRPADRHRQVPRAAPLGQGARRRRGVRARRARPGRPLDQRSHVLDNGQLTGGIDAVVDCVGSEQSIAQALRVCAPGGTVHAGGHARA